MAALGYSSPLILVKWHPAYQYKMSFMLLQVRKVTIAWCSFRQEVLPLLRRVAPHLEELEIRDARAEHLEAISDMPALRALSLYCGYLRPGFEVPALPSQLQQLRLVDPYRTPQHVRSLAGLGALRKLRLEGRNIPADIALCLPPQLEELRLDSATQAQLLQAVQSTQRLCR